MERDRFVDDLTLALIYLTSWKEKGVAGDVRRAWKGYDWDSLDRLDKAGYLNFSRKAKSL